MRIRSMAWLCALGLFVSAGSIAVMGVTAPAAFAAKNAGKKAGKKAAVRGKVSSVDAGAKTFVVNNKKAGSVTVSTTDQTTFTKADGSAGTFADVTAGSHVAVSGSAVADGKTTATAVKLTVHKKKAKKAKTQ